MGVPTIACDCAVCRSADPHDRRTRPSVLFSFAGREVIVDTTPDFRYQTLRIGLQRLDAVLYTHAHADHILGLDDIRAFNIKQRASVPIYASEDTLATLRRTFAYIFEATAAEGSILPGVDFHPISGPFELFGAQVTPVPAMHGPLPVLGYRIGSIGYLTDFSSLGGESKRLLQGLDHLVLDALRYIPHSMHSTVDQSLALVRELTPKQAWFTHICHDLSHEAANARLPENVRLAYDGLSFEGTY
jgi:phosphoribosyl 1,2-cyclic phosphate phosphodiesterase